MIYRVPGSWNILCRFSLGIYLDLGWSVASTGDIRKVWTWADACWLLLPCKGSLSDVGLLSECVWALSTVCLATAAVPVLFPGVWERASGCGDPQAGFLPKSCLDGEIHEVRRDFLFCFSQATVTIDYKNHTHMHTHTHTHTCVCIHTHQNRNTYTKQDVLSPPFAGVQGNLLPSVSLSPMALDFPIMIIKPLALAGDVTES